MPIMIKTNEENEEELSCNCDKAQIPALEATGWVRKGQVVTSEPELEHEDFQD